MRGRLTFITCYAASGAAALIYQVAWTRIFSLQLGHTTAASSTVLAAFMGGMAAGAWFGGKASPRPGLGLLQSYAAIELFIGAIAIVLPGALDGLIPVLGWAYADGTAPTFFATLRVAFSLLLIGIPAAAMGATFPIAVMWLTAAERATPRSSPLPAAGAGLLYAANTFGAALGAIGAGFWLIPALGLRATTWIGVALNVAAAAGAMWIARRPVEPVREKKKKLPVREPQTIAVPARPLLAAAAAGLSGFLALVYEVAWTRLLALVLGPTTYAFSIMAASFITGIAAGSLIGTRVARRGSHRSVWLGAALIVTAASAPAAAWFAASRLPMVVAQQVNAGAAFDAIILQQVLAVAGVLLPTSMALGATFVLALASATGEATHVGQDVAHVYVANTVGAVAGALSAGFLLIPRLGLQQTFNHISALGASGGVLIVALAIVPRRRPRALAAAAALTAAIWMAFNAAPQWDRELLASGGYKYARGLDSNVLDEFLRAGTLEYYNEGAAGTVSVRALAGSRALAIDGKVDASNAGDMLTQRLLGLLPVLLHPEPRDALVIGLGSGVTADAVLATGTVEHLDVVEISPGVVQASAYFERENRSVLRNPRTRLLVGDGRSHLRLSRRLYDVIVSEPSNPWMGGVAALFTREFFEAARERLRAGGVFCQWAHTYEIAEADLRSIVQTFASVFPEGTMWLVGESDLLLIGSTTENLESRLSALGERSHRGAAPALLSTVGIPPDSAAFVLLSLFAGGPGQLAAFANGAPLQTDDRMELEFTAPRAMYAPSEGNAARLSGFSANAAALPVIAAAMQRARAADWNARGSVALQAKAFAMATDSFRRALELDSESVQALRGLTESAAGAQRLTEETEWLRSRAAAEPRNIAVRVELSHALAALGRTDEAVAVATDAVRLDPERPEPRELLASIFADLGDAPRLSAAAAELVQRFPERDDARYYQAAALFLAGRTTDAERPIRLLLSANPRHAKGQNLLGALCASAAKPECAEKAFTAARELDPRDPSVYINLGYLRLARGDAEAAAEFFREALAIDTRSEAARRGLEEARAGQS
jgi:spermidine synthase